VTRASFPNRIGWRLLALLTLLAIAAGGRWWLVHKPSPPGLQPNGAIANPRAGLIPDDPRLSYATPYSNVRPDVKYVGDQSCARCHAELARSYHQHPMGRSLVPQAGDAPQGHEERTQNADFRALGFHYSVESQGDRVVHREMKEDGQGRVLAEKKAEVAFAVGSGTRGRSYLINHDGYVFQSPITWYPQRHVWDLSPGYVGRHHHFARPVTAECLFCHSNHADAVADTVNHYQTPIFQGYAIGCERCHGPGELHVRRHERGEELGAVDNTIVNPGRLDPALREAVCEQCHLQGDVRVLRRGLGPFDYRPGLPLHRFVSVFVAPAGSGETKKFVGHVEQMHASRCFGASAGKMGCISCHDPHQLPSAIERIAYYRDRCLTCHAEKGCSLSVSERLQKSKADSCIDCHMPAGKSDIPHASVTDHRILLRPEPSGPPEPAPHGFDPQHQPLLVHFHRDLVGKDYSDIDRDLGIGLMDRIERYAVPTRRALGQQALPLLDKATQGDKEDLPARRAKATALWACGQTEQAVAEFEEILRKAPLHEATLHNAATLAMELERPDSARAYWERAIIVNPWRYEFHYGLAAARAQLQDWSGAVAECQRALDLNPFKWEVRKLLVRCYLALGAKDRAHSAFELLPALEPREAAALRRWYAEHNH
jgi:Flp pilus assembly protein TadD